MAISARTAQLKNQRSPYGKLKILAPVNTSINSINRQNTQSELKTMIERYNDGEISNEVMQSFFSRIVNTPGLTVSEKVDVEDRLRDFNSLVRKDQLETAFKIAPELSLEKEQAAQALSNFYSERAASMSPGTPAQSQALQNAADWSNQVASIRNSVEKQTRKNMRYLAEQKINAYPAGSEKAMQTAQMYSELAQQAMNDGDATEANRLQALSVQYQTQAQTYASKESESQIKDQRSNIINTVNSVMNAYHDGTATADQVYQVLSEVDNWAVNNNDTSLQLKINSLTDQVAKVEAAGGYRRTTSGGLPTVVGKGVAGGQTTNWDTEDYNYSDNLKTLNESLSSGQIDEAKYKELLGQILQSRDAQIKERVSILESMAASNPNDKYYYEGRKQRVTDLLNSIYAEQDKLDPQIQAFQNGSMAIMQIAPDKKAGKNAATYQLIDVNAIPEKERDQYTQDESGIYHKILQEQINLTPEQMASAINNVYIDENGNSQYVRYDSSGNPYISGKQYVETYEPGTSKSVKQYVSPDQPIQSYAKYDQTQKEAAVAAEQQKTNELQSALKPLNGPAIMPPTIDKTGKQAVNINAKMPGLVAPTPEPKPVNKVQEVVNKVAPMVAPVVNKVAQTVAPVVNNVQQTYKSLPEPIKFVANPGGYVADKLTAPSYSAPYTPPGGGEYANTINVNNQTMVKQYDPNKGITYQPLNAPKPPEPKKNLLQTLGTWIFGK